MSVMFRFLFFFVEGGVGEYAGSLQKVRPSSWTEGEKEEGRDMYI